MGLFLTMSIYVRGGKIMASRRSLCHGVIRFLPVLVLLSLLVSALPPSPARAQNNTAPQTVTIPGTIQSKVGCSGDWQPDCDKTFLAYSENSDVWKGVFDLPAGDYEYKVALDKSWKENYGLKALRDGPNIPLHVEKAGKVSFYYDHKTHWVTDNINSVIVTAVGNFQTKLGCKQDNDPGCLRSWLEDPEASGIYSFVTTGLPAGNYEVKVAINESMDETYGADSTKNGPSVSFSVKKDNDEIYFGYDPNSHELTVSTEGAPRGDISKAQAHWISRDTILWNITNPDKYSYRLYYDPEGGLKLTAGGITGGQMLKLAYDKNGPSKETRLKYPYLAAYSAFKLDPADLDKVPGILKGQIVILAQDENGKTVNATSLQIPGVLDDLYTYGGPLGISYEGSTPSLRIWAPTAKSISLHLFDSSTTPISTTLQMASDVKTGVWSITGKPDWTNKFYLYEVEVYVDQAKKVVKSLVTDPYSLSLSMNSTRSQLVNLDDPSLAPANWLELPKPVLAAPEDIVIYELHIRDFSANDETVPEEHRGTYLAFTDLGSNGMKHLQALQKAGLTHIHLLPAFDIATINEDKSTWKSVDTASLSEMPGDSEGQQAAVAQIKDEDGFNWGYDPYHYTTPEGSYSTQPDGSRRIMEFRQMVAALNQVGLRVVMDVVYNHTVASGLDPKSVLDKVVPGYYHRLNAVGNVETSTCCQNTASEHAMMEKLMIDSVVTWAREYKVDGFRFDLMGHHMVSNMENLRKALDALTPDKDGVNGKEIYVYGEGWNFGEVINEARGVNATQINMAGTGIGTFNDRLRDGARGGSPFDKPQKQGFLTGLFYDPNALNQGSPDEQKDQLLHIEDWIRVGLAGNLRDFPLINQRGNQVTGDTIDYNGAKTGYTLDPQENIVYVSAHDNATLFDAIQLKAAPSATLADRVRMQNMGNDLVLLSQGIPFVLAGDELLRSKSMDGDSYNSGDWFNAIDYSYNTNNWAVGLPPADKNKANWLIMQPLLANTSLKPQITDIQFALAHFLEMLQVRKSSRLFRLETAKDIMDRVHFLNTGPDQIPGLIVMDIQDVEGDRRDPVYSRVVVLFNATTKQVSFGDNTFKNTAFTLHPVLLNSADPIVKQSSIDPVSGVFTVPGRTTAVFVVEDAVQQAPATSIPTYTPASYPAPVLQQAATPYPYPGPTQQPAQTTAGSRLLGGNWLPWLGIILALILFAGAFAISRRHQS